MKYLLSLVTLYKIRKENFIIFAKEKAMEKSMAIFIHKLFLSRDIFFIFLTQYVVGHS